MGSNCSFGPCYSNTTINFQTMRDLSLFLLVLQRPLKHQNLILHRFYLVELSCKLYNPFFRVVFHNPDNITCCNFSVRTLQHCHCMGKRPGKMRNDAFCEGSISLGFFFCNLAATIVRWFESDRRQRLFMPFFFTDKLCYISFLHSTYICSIVRQKYT